MEDEGNESRPSATSIRTVARVLTVGSNGWTKSQVLSWFPDARFEEDDWSLFDRWFWLYKLKSVKTDRGR